MGRLYFLSAMLMVTAGAWAHLTPSSLKLSKTGPYHAGDTITVTYGVAVTHGGVNVDFSSDGGKTWKTLQANFPARSTGNFTYKWAVTQSSTQQGKLRICQMGNSTPCTDANNADNPSGGPNYWLVSPAFTIDAATSLKSPADAAAPSLSRNASGFLELGFTLPKEGLVRLQAYDADGRLAGTLLEEGFSAGSHRRSLFSESLRAHPEWMLRLSIAGRMETLRR